MAVPAREWLAQGSVMALGDKSKGRRAGAAIEVFVAAAHGKVRVASIELADHRASRVRQVPDHQRAHFMSAPRDGGHVVALAAFVVDVGQGQDGDFAR